MSDRIHTAPIAVPDKPAASIKPSALERMPPARGSSRQRGRNVAGNAVPRLLDQSGGEPSEHESVDAGYGDVIVAAGSSTGHDLQHQAGSDALSRTNTRSPAVQRKAMKPATKQKPRAPAKNIKYGEIRLSREVAEDVLSQQMERTGKATGALFQGADNFHIHVSADGRLGYDAAHTDPDDPFRWEKIKELVDLGTKVSVKRVGGLDDIPTLKVELNPTTHQWTRTPIPTRLLPTALGVTLITEATARVIWPNDIRIFASRSADTHEIYYTLFGGSAETSALAHELLGHLWLAAKGVACIHPRVEDRAEVAARGTLYGKTPNEKAILDPYGNVYTGTVRNFIDTFVGSEFVATWASPTQFVSTNHIRKALEYWKDNFGKDSTGAPNGDWKFSGRIGDAWRVLNINHHMLITTESLPPAPIAPASAAPAPAPASAAPAPAPASAARVPASAPSQLSASTFDAAMVESVISSWYAAASPAEQYRFMRFIRLNSIGMDILGQTSLTTKMRETLAPPKGMAESLLGFPQ